MSTEYIVVDVYPQPACDRFDDVVGAVVGCWVRPDLLGTDDAREPVSSKLTASGWHPTRVLQRVQVDRTSVRPEHVERYEQAQLDGFVAQFHLRRRERVPSGGPVRGVAEPFLRFVAALLHQGVVWTSPSTERVTPDGDAYVPLLLERPDGDAVGWPLDELVRRHLAEIDARENWVGCALQAGALTTFHALAVRDALLGGSRLGLTAGSL